MLSAVPVVLASVEISNATPVVIWSASTAITCPVVCSESILNALALAFAAVLKSISKPILAAEPALLPVCAILTKLPALSLVAESEILSAVPVVLASVEISNANPVVKSSP